MGGIETLRTHARVADAARQARGMQISLKMLDVQAAVEAFDTLMLSSQREASSTMRIFSCVENSRRSAHRGQTGSK